MPSESINLSDDMDGVKINKNGTKVKVPADTIEDSLPEIIFIKQ